MNIFCSEKERVQRVVLRDNRDELEVKAIIAKQWTDLKRKNKSDYSINNEVEKLIPQVVEIFNELSQKK